SQSQGPSEKTLNDLATQGAAAVECCGRRESNDMSSRRNERMLGKFGEVIPLLRHYRLLDDAIARVAHLKDDKIRAKENPGFRCRVAQQLRHIVIREFGDAP